jgi:CheY-like chemotaxis protein
MSDEPYPTHILLVDDDPISAATVLEILEQADMESDVAATYAEAAQVLRRQAGRCLVLLNAHTQPAAGAEFMRKLDQDADLRRRCVVVDIARALGNSAALPARESDRVIERPLSPRELLAVVRGYLDGTELR